MNKSQNKRYPFLFYIITVIFIPFIFLVLLELTLMIAGYGEDIPQWVAPDENAEHLLMLNPDIAKRYFPGLDQLPTSINDVFDKEKSENALRIFVLGASSAAGFPFEPNGSFSRYMEDRLRLLYPDRKIEVVNIGIAAVNTYTILDLLPGIIEQEPDIVLIYAGHNEYYGAFGTASAVSFGESKAMTDFVMWMRNFRTFRLLSDITGLFRAALSEEEKSTRHAGTLMRQVASDKLVEYESDLYAAGIEQYSENLNELIEEFKDAEVPVIIGTLTSNLRSLEPFVSTGQFDADKIFAEAESMLNVDTEKAKELFTKAKDFDALRFRAPGEFNRIIKKASRTYNIRLIDIDSVFNNLSPYGITGGNIMTDHLHPTLEGYQLIGSLFSDAIASSGYAGKSKVVISPKLLDSLTQEHFLFTELDSLIAACRITHLTNQWPFTDGDPVPLSELFAPDDAIDSLAFDVATGQLSWYDAHVKAADHYIANYKFGKFIWEYRTLLDQYPFQLSLYNNAGYKLMQQGDFDRGISFFRERYRIDKDPFVAKWIGIYELSHNNINKAYKYFTEVYEQTPDDPQLLYNLAGVHVKRGDYRTALSLIKRCVELKPDYPGAAQLKVQLEKALGE